MFADAALAARIDRAEGNLCAGLARLDSASGAFVLPLAGGEAVYLGPNSPLNKVIAIGLDQPLDLAQLAEVERRWSEVNEPVRIELCNLVDPGIPQQLTERGYIIHGFENVLGRAVGAQETATKVDGLRIALAEDDRSRRAWLDIGVEAFLNMDGTGSVADSFIRAEIERAMEVVLRAPGYRCYVAWLGDTPVGSAGMRIDGTLAQIAGAGTLPRYRGRGIQKALLHRRLEDARQAGCDLAVVTTSPGTRSQDNVMRRGFSLLYTRVVLVRPLAPQR